jgi:hypothetical protein
MKGGRNTRTTTTISFPLVMEKMDVDETLMENLKKGDFLKI